MREEARRAKAARRTNKLELDDFLTKGQCIFSTNGKYKAIFQDDGNFVVYEYPEGVPIWASDTWGNRNADRVIMQGDCNLVMCDTKGTALWQSNTHMPNCQACCLTMQDDGNLVIYRDNKEIWSARKNKIQSVLNSVMGDCSIFMNMIGTGREGVKILPCQENMCGWSPN
ncbi:B-type lectin plumieribetin-like [Acipenser ruthenus]|uniref:B-type lectin plumieribetin-like n=1 Tax=Acipenser ruthenus TaxID=7906 RepID=UPI0027418F25|nr:B-type lectin plumieribetin-like [Acipenser ruthenus]